MYLIERFRVREEQRYLLSLTREGTLTCLGELELHCIFHPVKDIRTMAYLLCVSRGCVAAVGVRHCVAHYATARGDSDSTGNTVLLADVIQKGSCVFPCDSVAAILYCVYVLVDV